MEKPTKMDDLGVPPWLGNPQIMTNRHIGQSPILKVGLVSGSHRQGRVQVEPEKAESSAPKCHGNNEISQFFYILKPHFRMVNRPIFRHTNLNPAKG